MIPTPSRREEDILFTGNERLLSIRCSICLSSVMSLEVAYLMRNLNNWKCVMAGLGLLPAATRLAGDFPVGSRSISTHVLKADGVIVI